MIEVAITTNSVGTGNELTKLRPARARGKKGGRPAALGKDKRDLAVRLYHENTMPIAKICSMLGISKPTLYAYVRSAETKPVAA